jgi:hypothetical protein
MGFFKIGKKAKGKDVELTEKVVEASTNSSPLFANLNASASPQWPGSIASKNGSFRMQSAMSWHNGFNQNKRRRYGLLETLARAYL